MKIELNIKERLQLLNILPQSGSYLNMMKTENIREKVQVTNEESREINLRSTSKGWEWGPTQLEEKAKSDIVKEIEFDSLEIDIIKKCVEEIDENEKVDNTNFVIVKKVYDTLLKED